MDVTYMDAFGDPNKSKLGVRNMDGNGSGINTNYITEEIAKHLDIPIDLVRVADAADKKKVFIFIRQDMDEDEIETEEMHKYIRSFGYTSEVFAAAEVKIVGCKDGRF